MNVSFVKSAVLPEDWPNHDRAEVLFAGRSNAGKSSVINALLNHRLAKVSGQPGKTRLLNFFYVSKDHSLVDSPGYGFAKRSQKELEQWRVMMETYLTQRKQLEKLILVMDIRRDWTNDEQVLVDTCLQLGKKVVIVLNKADKLSRMRQKQRLKLIENHLGVGSAYLVSCPKKQGIKELKLAVFGKRG
jgi:GTP-binding protein